MTLHSGRTSPLAMSQRPEHHHAIMASAHQKSTVTKQRIHRTMDRQSQSDVTITIDYTHLIYVATVPVPTCAAHLSLSACGRRLRRRRRKRQAGRGEEMVRR